MIELIFLKINVTVVKKKLEKMSIPVAGLPRVQTVRRLHYRSDNASYRADRYLLLSPVIILFNDSFGERRMPADGPSDANVRHTRPRRCTHNGARTAFDMPFLCSPWRAFSFSAGAYWRVLTTIIGTWNPAGKIPRRRVRCAPVIARV